MAQHQALQGLSADRFRDLCDGVRSARVSLVSCKDNEIVNEAAILKRALDDLCAASLARKNEELRRRRSDLILMANETLAMRAA